MGKRRSKVRVERYLKGLRQIDLSALTSIPQVRISRIERGEVVPNDEEKNLLAQAFGLKPVDLLPDCETAK